MTATKFLSEKIILQSKYFRVKEVMFEREGKKLTREIVERTPIVAVLPYTQNHEVYLESQYRIVYQKEILEIVAGHIEPGDEPLAAAKRELAEETGLTANSWKQVATWNVSSNMQQSIYVFFTTELTEGEKNLDDDEIIETIKMPIDEATEKISTGEISVGFHAGVLLLFDKLRREGKL